MNRRSSYCLRVSISSVPQFAVFKSRYVPFDSSRLIRKVAPESQMTLICRHQESKTNHERTLYVPYVFRNHLISRQRDSFCRNRALAGSVRKPQDLASRAGGGLWRKRGAYHKRPCRSELSNQRGILMVHRRAAPRPLPPPLNPRPPIAF